MERNCKRCQAGFTVQPDEETFLRKMTFAFGTKTINPALPVYCPDCRCLVRTCHRNERNMYKTRSAFSGKDIISLYHPNAPFTVYEQEEWKSDAWDPLEYGRDFDFSKPFFEQFAALQKDVPRMALITVSNENSGFTTGTAYCKNCYLINSSEYCEDCYYGKLLQKCKDSVDCSYLYDSELCYECFSCYESYNCTFVAFSQNCNDCLFSSNLQSCKNCCLCTNLIQKEYHFLNEPLSKEEYRKRLMEFRGNYALTERMKQLWKEKMTTMQRKYGNIVHSEECTGDYIEHSKNCHDCYDVNESEDCRYVQVGVNVKDNYDCSNMYLKPELCYETLGTIEVYNVAYCLFVFNSKNLLYCDYCFHCTDCFACTGLTRKQYCIFNKQYAREEYEKRVPEIVKQMEENGEWGLFFPSQISPFSFNESLAYEYFPLTKSEAASQGLLWREADARDYKPQTIAFPESIQDAPDSITQEIFACEDCTKNFRIIPQELAFHRNHLLPLPHVCPDCRHRERMRLRNPRTLYKRPCGKCKKEMQTTYAPDRSEVILCEECYRKDVY
ncbi:hypothetical protein COU76_00980 [Candidatus Peregrinibacteria bacterium CG10_big_fil_rev_8_21_14_0_10_49_10]|nr:MAG: hypothetical protein COU76_00980 [Candidatus Peregrinibacteria bacterium CG10_big_fil_rev_8_21_14_0_10_49_10]